MSDFTWRTPISSAPQLSRHNVNTVGKGRDSDYDFVAYERLHIPESALADGSNNEVLTIFGIGAPNSVFDDAPPGSRYFDTRYRIWHMKTGIAGTDSWAGQSTIPLTTTDDHTGNSPKLSELDTLLDAYFTALLGSTQDQSWAVVLGTGTKVVLNATGGAGCQWEMISNGTVWHSQQLSVLTAE
jgi:hypothetical protein